MNLADTEQKSASGAVVASTANTRLSGTRLIVARAVWLVLVVPSLGLYVISLPVYYQQLQTACFIGTACGKLYGALPVKGLPTLSTTGFSVSGYAALFTIFFAITAAIWCAVGFIIFWRRSDDWLALLAAFFLVMSSHPFIRQCHLFAGTRLSRLRFAFQSLRLSWANLPLCVLSALPQWTACPALDGTDPAARHHQCVLKQLPFHHVNFRNELARMAQPAG